MNRTKSFEKNGDSSLTTAVKNDGKNVVIRAAIIPKYISITKILPPVSNNCVSMLYNSSTDFV